MNNESKSNKSERSMLSLSELEQLFDDIGAVTTLSKIRTYVYYRRNYLDPKDYFIICNDSTSQKIYEYIAILEPDEFFDSYYSDYFGFSNVFSLLYNNFFFNFKFCDSLQIDLLRLLYLLYYYHERTPYKCIFNLYMDLCHRFGKQIINLLDYKKFCDIWRYFFITPKIASFFPNNEFSDFNDSLNRLNIFSTHEKSLIILYAILYRDYKKCEHTNSRIEKLRDGNDTIETIKIPHAVFTIESFDSSKPRFLNKLFTDTAPEKFMYDSNWKKHFSTILVFLYNCSLDFCVSYLLPELSPSISTLITFLSKYPGRKKHSIERKVMEIVCAYTFSIQSTHKDKLMVFKNYLNNVLLRDGIKDYTEIFEHLNKLNKSYAVTHYRGNEEYKKIYNKTKPSIKISSATPKNLDKAFFDFHVDNDKDIISSSNTLLNMPALNFMIENQHSYKDSMIEVGIIFEEAANYVMHTRLHCVVLLQPSYAFIYEWLTDFRTKNVETTIVIYDERIVNYLRKKLKENNLISKEKYYQDQETSFNIHIESSINNISDYDLAFSFYNKKEPNYEDLVTLSRMLNGGNRMVCVLSHLFFEQEEYEDKRKQLLSYSNIHSIINIQANLFDYTPKKKYIVEFEKNDKVNLKNDISIRFIDINKELQGVKGKQIKNDLGLYYIIASESTLTLGKPYEGESINFKEAYNSQYLPEDIKKRNRAKAIRFAPDFRIFYTVTNHAKSRQATCYFAKYLDPRKKKSNKKDYGIKIKGSQISLTAKDDTALELKIVNDFPSNKKYLRLRDEAKKEIKSALEQGRLNTLTLFTFSFAYNDDIKNKYSNFDYKFCYKAFCRTSLGALVLNEATQEDFDKAISEIKNSNPNIDIYKLMQQLASILDVAVKKGILFDSQSPVFEYIEKQKRTYKNKAQMRSAFAKKTLSYYEERNLINWLIKNISKQPVYLGTLIKLCIGMSSREVCMLRWGDFCKTKYCDYYHFKVTKQMAEKSKEKDDLKSPFKYRIVPIPSFLSEILLKQIKEMHLTYRLSLDELEQLPIVIPSIKQQNDYCLANNLYLKSKKALKQGAEISEKIISYTENDKTKANDLNSYGGDFYVSNFKFHALNDAMMTTGEVAYILGLAPVDTFSRHYCDYTNPFLQKMLVDKLNDWFSLYKDWDGKPQFESGTTKSELKNKNIKISPYNSECTSGKLLLSVSEKLLSDIELTIASDRGIKGNITMYEEQDDD